MKNFICVFLLLGSVALQAQTNLTGFFPKNISSQLNTEQQFDKQLDANVIGANIKKLSAFPHHLNSPYGKQNAEYLLSQFKSFGWDAQIETFYVLFPTPRKRVLELVSPNSYKAVLQEPPLPEDPTSGQSGQLPPYNAYGADGDVTAELVFVNYGLPSDYEILKKMGVDVKGKIVIAKYGRSWRGTKPKVAQEHGAVGCIIYSDPIDDGYAAGDVYPKGPFKNEYGVQRGSVMDMVIHPGDPTTPGEGSVKDVKRLDRKDAETILKIPVLPISYHDAAPLLKALSGQVVPRDWQGGLPFTYHMGPGSAKVHLQTEFEWKIVPCYDVIAKIEGAQFPDEWIIRGNHHDAWVNGAADPVSGLSAMMEEARSIGLLLKSGWKPKRTLVYCAWDGEEQGLLGSTEWLETHQKELEKKAVVYINSDNNGRGFLFAEGSHALEPFMTEIAKSVTDPQTGVSVFERRKAFFALMQKDPAQQLHTMNAGEMKLGAMGSGSDYSSFIQHAGIPALSLGFGGEDNGGEYHSIYDSYTNFVKYKDPGFLYAKALAQTAGRAVLRMANADVLPFRFTHLYNTINGYAHELTNLLEEKRLYSQIHNELIGKDVFKIGNDPQKHFNLPDKSEVVPFLNFAPLENALNALRTATDSLQEVYDRKVKSVNLDDAFNKFLYTAEQQLLSEKGLPMRPWYKHTIYAPGYYTGYGVKTLPGIREAIEENKWDEAQEQIEIVAKSLETFADYLLKGSLNTD